MSALHTPVKGRARIAFNPLMLVHATGAVVDLSDPLRTNVKMSVGDADMYADLSTLLSLHESGEDESGASSTIVNAWEKALSGRTSNMFRLEPTGVLHIHLLGIPQGVPIPSRSRLM